MPQHIQAPDGSLVEFPDDMTDAQMAAVMRREYHGADSRPTSQAQGALEGFMRPWDNLAGLLEGGLDKVGVPTARINEALGGKSVEQMKAERARAFDESPERSGGLGKFGGEVLGTLPTMAIRGPQMAGNAAAGYLTSDAEDVKGKLVDAGISAVGGKLMGAGLKKFADFAAPVIDPAVRRLTAAGVRLTPGQIRGGKAMVGEDKLTSLPFVGDAIAAGRGQSLLGSNIAGVNRILEPLKAKLPAGVQAGHDAIDAAHRMVSDAYGRVVPKLSMQLDPRFVAGMRTLYQDVATLPEAQQNQFQSVLKQIKFGQGGTLAGKQLQNALSEVNRLKGVYQTSAVASERELGKTLGGLRDELGNLLMRQNPSEAPALKAADGAFRGLAIVENAASRGDGGVFSPGQLKQAVRAADGSRRKSATARGQALLQDFAEDLKRVVPSKTPDSGTAGRMMKGGIVPSIRGGSALLGHKLDSAITEALAKAPPKVAARLRSGLLALEKPGGLLGGLGTLAIRDRD